MMGLVERHCFLLIITLEEVAMQNTTVSSSDEYGLSQYLLAIRLASPIDS